MITQEKLNTILRRIYQMQNEANAERSSQHLSRKGPSYNRAFGREQALSQVRMLLEEANREG